VPATGLGNAPSAVSATATPLTLIGITSALLLGVLATAKGAEIAVRVAELPRVPDVMPRVTPLRTLALGGVTVLQPALSTQVPSSAGPTDQEQTPSAPPPVSPGSAPPTAANSPHATGPPAPAGPPEGSPAPEHAGRQERTPPSRASAVP
jgi:hypothetical protein